MTEATTISSVKLLEDAHIQWIKKFIFFQNKRKGNQSIHYSFGGEGNSHKIRPCALMVAFKHWDLHNENS